MKRASETRQKLLQGLDNLDSIFKDIELFLNTFPTEKNVCEAGRDLVVSVLVAAEKLIGFYLKQKGKLSYFQTLNHHRQWIKAPDKAILFIQERKSWLPYLKAMIMRRV